VYYILYNMKQIDTRHLQHHLGSYLDRVEAGETLEVRRRHKVIAKLVPFVAESESGAWPDIEERLERIYPEGPLADSASDRLYADRGDR
jgi:antitoxin (DNA-binding transcriptional repressor) of toxin-antitoxin stability system